jgi:uncharacterized protein YdeI (YjbR/CyaY-like superfamily)
MNPKVDSYFSELTKWRKELEKIRVIILACGLTEKLKWGIPCYTFGKGNVVGINGLKDFCALSFFKGVLLNDAEGILVQPWENTQAGRWIKFANLAEITGMEEVLKNYIHEAVEVEKAGLEVEYKKTADYEVPEELQTKLDEAPDFKAAFKALTPGRQRGYILHFSAPKQSKTRASRIEACTPRIMDGKGFHDCICGLSKKMPACDGSHKFIGCV